LNLIQGGTDEDGEYQVNCNYYEASDFVNVSYSTGYTLASINVQKIIPIFKADEKDKYKNYRPISILPALSKLLEKIAAIQIFRYLNKFNIFYKHQYMDLDLNITQINHFYI